jgi:hypothetical protein
VLCLSCVLHCGFLVVAFCAVSCVSVLSLFHSATTSAGLGVVSFSFCGCLVAYLFRAGFSSAADLRSLSKLGFTGEGFVIPRADAPAQTRVARRPSGFSRHQLHGIGAIAPTPHGTRAGNTPAGVCTYKTPARFSVQPPAASLSPHVVALLVLTCVGGVCAPDVLSFAFAAFCRTG